MTLQSAIHGAILGTVIGDALGLPYEALSRRRGVRLLGPPNRHRFILGRGMMSDDGEHTCMAAAALCASGGDVEKFRRSLAWQLRWWLLGIPAGIGGATLRAVLKLWIGFSPRKSGVFSAGNGPTMRSAVLGAAIDGSDQLRTFVEASTRITHTDPKAFYGAMAIALAARISKSKLVTGQEYLEQTRAALPESAATELINLLSQATMSVDSGESTSTFAARIGSNRGVSGYVYQTVPVAIHAWLSHPLDYATAVQSVIECGGDIDTVAAIVGGIVGCGTGVDGIPADWSNGLLEWPRSLAWIERLAGCVNSAMQSSSVAAPPRVGLLVIFRNILFLSAVFVHVIRRVFPPY